MTTSALASSGALLVAGEGWAVLATQTEQHWYAAYTRAQHEKRVAEQLDERGVEHFLPLYASMRRWKDRRVRIDLPLFPGYVFVRLALAARLRVLQIPSVVCLVGFGGSLATLPDEDVEILRAGLVDPSRAEPHPFLTIGRRVRIACGPFAGMEGVLKRKKGNLRVVVSLDLIHRAFVVDVDAADVQPVSESQRSRTLYAAAS